MATITDEGVCVRVWDWSETSQTVSIFSREHGLLRALAKGAKRERSRYSGGLEAPSRGRWIAIVKAHSSLATLTSWDLLEVFPAVRRTLAGYYAGMYLVDLVVHTITDADPHSGLYDALVGSLRALDEPEGHRVAVLRYQWATLVETGYRPVLDRDVATGGELPEAATYMFSAGLGGVTVDGRGAHGQDARATGGGAAAGSRRPGGGGHKNPGAGASGFGAGSRKSPGAGASGFGSGSRRPGGKGGWRVRAGTIELLRALETSGALDASDHDAAAVVRASRLLGAYLREVLGREPPAMGAYFGVLGRAGRGGTRG